jgi:hypothetical protein
MQRANEIRQTKNGMDARCSTSTPKPSQTLFIADAALLRFLYRLMLLAPAALSLSKSHLARCRTGQAHC